LEMTRSVVVGWAMVLVLGGCAPQSADPNPVPDPEPRIAEDEDLRPASGEEALAWLLAGNHRFWDGHPRENHESMRRVAMLSEGQHPFAIVLGCADSRVSPELVFDHGLGDLFVIRVAGNVVAEDEAGSIEYALEHLDVPLLVVLGHENCGAVTAALGAHDEEPSELVELLRRILPAIEGIDGSLPLEQRVRLGVEANVRQSVAQLRAIQERLVHAAQERALIVGRLRPRDRQGARARGLTAHMRSSAPSDRT
jgi:carbonic anhydrase